jgi:hypothetical protein
MESRGVVSRLSLSADLKVLRRRREHLETRILAFQGPPEARSISYDRAEVGMLTRAEIALQNGGYDYSPPHSSEDEIELAEKLVEELRSKQWRDAEAEQLRNNDKWELHQRAERYREELKRVEEILQKGGTDAASKRG